MLGQAAAGIQSFSSWIPDLAPLARNDGLIAFVVPTGVALVIHFVGHCLYILLYDLPPTCVPWLANASFPCA